MIIGVMSDTHGHLTEMRKVATRMVEEFSADVIVHLGDDSTDADELRGHVPELISVPGIFERSHRDKNCPNRVIRDFGGVTFLLTHTPTRNAHDLPDDIDPTEAAQDGDAKVVLYGHMHKPTIAEKYNAIFINPGHLQPGDPRNAELTFAVIEVSGKKLHVKIVEASGGVLEEKTFFLD